METKTLKPYFVVLGLMVLTSLALAFTVDVNVTDQAGVRVYLPDRVGDWSGREMRFCQNELCQKEYHVDELKDVNVCPACGGPLGSMSFGEKLILPADTEILKKHYNNPNGRTIFVSIVMSGKERASIHRPQICLVGQGNEIIHSGVLDVPMDSRKSLEVMLLDMIRRGKTPAGQPYEVPTYYGYWFVGKGRETPYHVQRLIWMGTDRIFHNVSHRWAYIAVAGMRDPDGKVYQEEIRSFLEDLYPEMLINQG